MEKTYTESPELKALAEALISRYYLYIGHVDIDTVYFAEVEGAKPKTAKVGEISGVSSAWVRQLMQSLGNHRQYCLSVWGEEWMEVPTAHKEWLIFDALYSIDPENDGKLRKRDVSEHGIICEYLGPYWRKKEELPSLLSGDPLPIPPPPLDQDEGSTLGD